jgi:hypothetical protein
MVEIEDELPGNELKNADKNVPSKIIPHKDDVKIKIPPIVVCSHDYKKITNTLVYSNVLNYNVKFTSIGTKIFCKKIEDFNETIIHSKKYQLLIIKSVEFKPLTSSFHS